MQGVAKTALWVAAWRAKESDREDSLFHDPYARALAGDEGLAVLNEAEAARGGSAPTIEIRTHYFDEHLLAATRDRGLSQVAVLAAGVDARAWRLAWPEGVRLFEVDQPEMLAYKADRIAALGATARLSRREVPIDLRDDWPAALRAAGLDPARPTLWLVEGLLIYLDDRAVETLFARLDALSGAGSVALFDVMGRTLLESPWMTVARQFAASIDAPWVFGTDEPEALLAGRGWDVTALDLGELGVKLGRWPFPVAPPGVKGMPRSYLVEAVKR